MRKIQIKILNPESLAENRKMMAISARLTQHGEKINDMDSFMALFDKPISDTFIKNLSGLPHPILQHLTKINIAIIGISRREMTQLVRHRNDVHFISSSLQYSNYSNDADFMVPYSIIEHGSNAERRYLENCRFAMGEYKLFNDQGVDNDACGYMSPQGLRNVLIMSATPFELKHIISQRTCRRNTAGTRYVMLKIWEELYKLDPIFFAPDTTGPFCQRGSCKEGKMSCGKPIDKAMTPTDILHADFPLLYETK